MSIVPREVAEQRLQDLKDDCRSVGWDGYIPAIEALEFENAALRAEFAARGPVWVPVSEAPETHGVYAVWIEADSPPRAFHGYGYYDGSDGWKMVKAADEYRLANPAFEDYGMRVVFYVRGDELAPPDESNLLSRQGNMEGEARKARGPVLSEDEREAADYGIALVDKAISDTFKYAQMTGSHDGYAESLALLKKLDTLRNLLERAKR